MSATPVIPLLPTCISLILHLHILSYSKCNSPEYSTPALFAPTRPLRDRMRTMEDIVAFLIALLEGKARCKSILNGTYPCLQGSDSIAFRIHVTKYLEALRHSAVRSDVHNPTTSKILTKAVTNSSKSKAGDDRTSDGNSRGPSPASNRKSPAWWWTNVMVRKSLLEECTGDRFEKLLLSLSTHVLSVRIPSESTLHPSSKDIPFLIDTLIQQPEAYSTLLLRCVETHGSRLRQMGRLNSRASSLISLRTSLALRPQDPSGPRTDLNRLANVRDSRKQEIGSIWDANARHFGLSDLDTNEVLEWILRVAGVAEPNSEIPSHRQSLLDENSLENTSNEGIIRAQTLPIAAAHHPRNSRKITTLPQFISPQSHPDVTGVDGNKPHRLSSSVLQELFDSSIEQNQTLREVLDRTMKQKENISSRLDIALKTEKSSINTKSASVKLRTMTKFDFGLEVDNTNEGNAYLRNVALVTSSTEESETQIEEKFETDIFELRESLQPRFPTPGSFEPSLSETRPDSQELAKENLPNRGFISAIDESTVSTPRATRAPLTPERTIKKDTKFVTPRTNRRSTLLPSIIAATGRGFDEDFLADVSLPEISFDEIDEFMPLQKVKQRREDEDFEEHSVTLRDILLQAGDADGSFDLMAAGSNDESDDSEDGLQLGDIPEWE
ncbi:hypothetical protein M422DRAFT_774281 [Sphaerobolus stellatus SS14]|nr:hypothetical protein M422DRAFT_774281 [Sphaerobolus stellatus SS14]